MAKGKNLTVSQKKFVSDHGVSDPNDWLYLKTITESNDESKHAAKGSDKTISMVIVNRFTSDTKVIPMN